MIKEIKKTNVIKELKDKRAFVSIDLFLGIFAVLLAVLVISKFLL